MALRPPHSSDSEDDYDGFSFGNEFDEKPKNKTSFHSQLLLNHKKKEEEHQQLMEALNDGDVNKLKQLLCERDGTNDETKINYDAPLKDGWSLLLHAVRDLKFKMVRYLIWNGANVNGQIDSLTPLMVACKVETIDEQINTLMQITMLLLREGAVVNIRDKTGCTPLMFACMQGNKEIVNLLLDSSIALEAEDNFGYTALLHAVENNHIEIVKVLLRAGANQKVFNFAGLTPRSIASSKGFTDIEDLFESEEEHDDVPIECSIYQDYRDIAPTAFPDKNKPPYIQDLSMLLYGMRASECYKQLYEAQISLPELLLLDDDRLKDLGIGFEYRRKRILHGLLKFHIHPFSPASIQLVHKTKAKNLYQYYEMYAGYLKHLIVMNASVTYLQRMCGQMDDKEILRQILLLLDSIKNDLDSLHYHVKQISKLSQRNPIYIGPMCTSNNQRYKKIISPMLKFTLVFGMGFIFSYRLTKFFT